MVFNGDANDQDLCTLADLLVKTDDVDFPLKEKSMYANWALREIFAIIMSVYGGWLVDDSNNSGNPEATATLAQNTQVHAMATIMQIHGLEWKDANGAWADLIPITLEEIHDMGAAETEFMKTPGNPKYFRPVQNGVKLYPAFSGASIPNGLKAHGPRDISAFTPASTSVSPGYDSLAGHEAVAQFMAMKFADINTLDVFPNRFNDWLTSAAKIKSYYSEKFRRDFPKAIRKRGGYADQFVS